MRRSKPGAFLAAVALVFFIESMALTGIVGVDFTSEMDGELMQTC